MNLSTSSAGSPLVRFCERERAWLKVPHGSGALAPMLWFHPRGAPEAPTADALRFSLHRARVEGSVLAEREALPFTDASASLIVLQHVLESERVPAAFLGECVRVLAPGASLWIVGFNPLSPWCLRHRRALRTARAPRPQHALRLRALLASLGLSDFRIETRGPRWAADGAPEAWTREVRFGAVYRLSGRKSGPGLTPLRTAAEAATVRAAPMLPSPTHRV